MKLRIRGLINPLILTEEWVGFLGDSEYINSDGELVYGYWIFDSIDKLNGVGGEPYNLDDFLDEEEIYDKKMKFIVKNDNGTICKIKFIYTKH